MRLTDIIEKTGLNVICPGRPEADITGGYTGDLLSDVMANAPSDSVLITIQAHKNTIAVATLSGIRAVILCNGRSAPEDMKEAAMAEDIAILATADSQFAVSAAVASLIRK